MVGQSYTEGQFAKGSAPRGRFRNAAHAVNRRGNNIRRSRVFGWRGRIRLCLLNRIRLRRCPPDNRWSGRSCSRGKDRPGENGRTDRQAHHEQEAARNQPPDQDLPTRVRPLQQTMHAPGDPKKERDLRQQQWHQPRPTGIGQQKTARSSALIPLPLLCRRYWTSVSMSSSARNCIVAITLRRDEDPEMRGPHICRRP